MRHKDVKNLKSTQFKRFTGVKREAFEQVLTALNEAATASKKYSGCGAPPKLSNVDKMLLLLMYYCEYRTQFHIANTYRIFESRVCEIIRDIETVLIGIHAFICRGKSIAKR